MRLFGRIASMAIVSICVIAIIAVSNMDTGTGYTTNSGLKTAFIVLAVLLACISFTDMIDIGGKDISNRRKQQGSRAITRSTRKKNTPTQPTARSRGPAPHAGKRPAAKAAWMKERRAGELGGKNRTTTRRGR